MMTSASPLSPPATRTPRIHALSAALAGGLGFGVLTNLAQGWLPGGFNQLANSGAVWSAVAFAAGAVSAGKVALPYAAVAGGLAELGLIMGYYGYAEYGFDRAGMGDLTWPLLWVGVAMIAGPLFGVAGLWARHGQTLLRRSVGVGTLAGIFGAEGIFATFILHYAIHATVCVTVLILLPLFMARTLRGRALALSTALVVSFVAYIVVYAQPLISR